MTIDFVPREKWGARPAKPGIVHRSADAVQAVVFHYAGVRAPSSPEQEVSMVRAIQRHHMDANGWADIGYHALIGPSGRVYVGRDSLTIGAHCAGFNTASIGLCVLTNDGMPSLAAIYAAEQSVLLNDFVFGRTLRILTHREKVATGCPGDRLHKWVVTARRPGGHLAR
jgi:hypothetical protein